MSIFSEREAERAALKPIVSALIAAVTERYPANSVSHFTVTAIPSRDDCAFTAFVQENGQNVPLVQVSFRISELSA